MSDEEILEGACLTLDQLCALAALDRDWLVRHVEEGLIPASGTLVAEWRFSTVHVTRARRMHEIERAYEAAPELAALVADLLEELDLLRARLGRGGG
jgi:chaperone modulatory protein CbpM